MRMHSMNERIDNIMLLAIENLLDLDRYNIIGIYRTRTIESTIVIA